MCRIEYIDADQAIKERFRREWGEWAARHMHLEDGFSIAAMCGDDLVGLVSVCWRELPAPLPKTFEGYIDIIEVREGYRRKGIARTMIEMAVQRARKQEAYQLRAWSSEDKVEAIPMWKALGFGLCPATTYPRGQEVRGYFVTKVL